ncbi:unnamed protein product, partial [Coregonus sp. 'balchen']
ECVEELAQYLKPLSNSRGVGLSTSSAQSSLSRPMQRKLVTLVHCQLVEEEGRVRATRAARSLGERTEEALKLVLLALEDGSALSRKVLVLFVVQRLEPRFPQASKTSIGHVVQLLYRASCFKLKEDFWTYEALRREHDSQIVQIAMEGGLRIAPDQWSSLLYGDQSHKSHMQSIIDKVCRRYSPPPTWELLDTGLVAVKTVVHGLVDFIQNHSKKGSDPQQPPQHSKYKTYMCRDMKQKGGCPRGASCTFAHSQDELEKYRKMNKRLAARRPLSLSLTQLNEVGLLPEEVGMLEGLAHKGLTNGMVTSVTGSALPQLISRGADPSYEPMMRKPQRPPMYPPQQGELFYPPEPRTPPSALQYESSQYPPGNPPYPYQPSQYPPQPRYIRNPPPPNDPALPPYPEPPYPGTYPQERQCPPPPQPSGPHFSNANPHGYPPPPHYDGRRHPAYPPPPPQSYPHREDPSSMPADEASRERYPPEGYHPPGPHPSHMRPYTPREAYSRPQPTPSLDYLHRRRQEIMAQLEDRKQVTPPPFAPSPTLPHHYESNYTQEQQQYMENSQAFSKYREPDYASQYSPWSCDTIGSYIGSKEGKSKNNIEMMNTEGKGVEGRRRAAEARDDDPIIPFGSLPTVSRFGVISRTPKTGYLTAGPGQAMTPSQGTNSPKHGAATADYHYGKGAGWGAAPYSQPPQAHLSERPVKEREQLTMELQQVNQQINKQTAQADQPSPEEWSSGSVSSQQLSLELHRVEREIGKRTRQIALEHLVCHDGSGAYKLKPTENGQRAEHSLVLSEGCNGSSGVLQGGSVASGGLSLSLSTDLPTTGGTDRKTNGVVHLCS